MLAQAVLRLRARRPRRRRGTTARRRPGELGMAAALSGPGAHPVRRRDPGVRARRGRPFGAHTRTQLDGALAGVPAEKVAGW